MPSDGRPLETEPGLGDVVRLEVTLDLTEDKGQVGNGRARDVHGRHVATRATLHIGR